MLRLCICLLCLTICIHAEAEVAKTPIINVIIKSIGCNDGPYQPKLLKTLKGIKALGKIKKEVIQPAMYDENNIHSVGSFTFDGMELALLLDNKNTTVSFIEGATFSTPRWNKVSPIAIGSSITDLFKKEGISKIPPKNSIVSACSSDEEATDCINLTLKNLIIIKAEYLCYTG